MGMSCGQWHGYDGMTIPAIANAEYTADIDNLIPVIWHHGFASINIEYQVTMMEMASHGYLCFNLNDKQGVCAYTEDPDGKSQFFDPVIQAEDFAPEDAQKKEAHGRWKEVIANRVAQTSNLINELETEGFLSSVLPGIPK